MRTLLLCCVGLGLAALLPAARGDEAVLTVSYAGKSVSFTAADLAAMPHQTISALDGHDKKTHEYTGVPAKEVLARVNVPSGEKLRGPSLRLIVIAHTKDNYEVAYALAEFDEAFSDRTILLVDRQDGQPLLPATGPLRLLLPGDKRPARWARMINLLEIVQVGEDRK